MDFKLENIELNIDKNSSKYEINYEYKTKIKKLFGQFCSEIKNYLKKYMGDDVDTKSVDDLQEDYNNFFEDPNYKLNFLNPLSFIFDLEVRDIAEYIKSAFFAGVDALSYLKETLRIAKFSVYSLELLYARLLYPSYYFDIYEAIMNDLESEEKLIPIIEKADDYEDFLRDAYLEINKYAPIEGIDWLIKNIRINLR